MKEVLSFESCPETGPLYYMYRNLARSAKDREWLGINRLRYDVTVIPPRLVCGEFVKTKGHIHPPGPGGLPYPELYEVRSGFAHFLLQKMIPPDILVIEARAGEAVVIPPGYGHISINPSHLVLVMANLVSTSFESDYRIYENMRGGAYYEMASGECIRNPRYGPVPPIRWIKARQTDLGRIPIYSMIGDPDALRYLEDPRGYEEILRHGVGAAPD